MPTIAILSSSVRNGRASHRVALFFQDYIRENSLGDIDLIDLRSLNFPVFEERLKFLKEPPEDVLSFADRIRSADAIIIVTPEYNGGYPASLKNVVDLLYNEWYRKPIGIATVSGGAFAGTQVITSLVFTLWKMKAWVVPSMFPVPKVEETFDEQGKPADLKVISKRAATFLQDILWCVKAKQAMMDNK